MVREVAAVAQWQATTPAGIDETAVEVDLSFSPLAHLPVGHLELVFGPKLGVWAGAASATEETIKASATERGWLLGGNVGLFGSLSPKAAVGGLLSLTARSRTEACLTAPGQAEQCSSSNLGSAAKVLGITAAMMF